MAILVEYYIFSSTASPTASFSDGIRFNKLGNKGNVLLRDKGNVLLGRLGLHLLQRLRY